MSIITGININETMNRISPTKTYSDSGNPVFINNTPPICLYRASKHISKVI